MRIDSPQITIIIVIPDLIEDLTAAQGLAGIAHEIIEELVFRRTEVDVLAVDDDLAGIAVDGDAIVGFMRFLFILGTAQEGFDLGDQDFRAERLGDVFIGTEVIGKELLH